MGEPMTVNQQRLAEGLELLLNAKNERLRAAVDCVERKCATSETRQYLQEGEALCKAAEQAAHDVLAAVCEYRATAQQLSDFRAQCAGAGPAAPNQPQEGQS